MSSSKQNGSSQPRVGPTSSLTGKSTRGEEKKESKLAFEERIRKDIAIHKQAAKVRPHSLIKGLKRTFGDEPPDVGALQSVSSMLISSSDVYKFRMVYNGFLTSSSGGVVDGYIDCDPGSDSDYANYLKYLFGQVRLVKARLHLVPISGEANFMSVMAVGYDSSEITTPPGGTAATLDLPRSFLMPTRAGTSCSFNRDGEWIIESPTRPNSGWAVSTNPSPSVDTGCFGSFLLYSSGNSNLVTLIAWWMELEIEVRGRE